MSFSIEPVVVKVSHLREIMGSDNRELLKTIITERREDFLNVDADDPHFDHFEPEIEAEYDAYERGDFSFKAQIIPQDSPNDQDSDDRDDTSDESDSVMADLEAAMVAGDHEKLKASIEDILSGTTFELITDDDQTDDEETPFRELTMGAALADLVLGRQRDPAYSGKYSIAFEELCMYVGHRPECDFWSGLRHDFFPRLTKALNDTFYEGPTLYDLMFGNVCPIELPDQDGSVGFVANENLQTGLGALRDVRAALPRVDPESRAWLQSALDELESWWLLAQAKDSDLLLFSM